jgi:hypothetical protein
MATYGTYGNRPIENYFGGQTIDPNFVIERFKQLLQGLIPNKSAEGSGANGNLNKEELKGIARNSKYYNIKTFKKVWKKIKHEGIKFKNGTYREFLEYYDSIANSVPSISRDTEHKESKQPDIKNPSNDDDAVLNRNLRKQEIFDILTRQGVEEDEIQKFWKKSANGRKLRIPYSNNESINAEKVLRKFKGILGTIESEIKAKTRLDDEQKTATEAMADALTPDEYNAARNQLRAITEDKENLDEELEMLDKNVRHDEELEAKSEYDLIQSKSQRLADVLKSKYNFKKTTKMPKGLDTDFMGAYPHQEADVIAKYETELEALKVKNDSNDVLGKQKESLEASDLQEKLAKLTAKKIRLQQRVKKIASDLVAPPGVIKTLKTNPRGKVKLDPKKGRGKSGKGKDIETIKVAISNT